ncbi:MAG TPA: hypothetical protein VNA15_03470 [Candidatus Angelobacter sp.]|nr:hypothetical protein [Candidatus Angelobacter sp.]
MDGAEKDVPFFLIDKVAYRFLEAWRKVDFEPTADFHLNMQLFLHAIKDPPVRMYRAEPDGFSKLPELRHVFRDREIADHVGSRGSKHLR